MNKMKYFCCLASLLKRPSLRLAPSSAQQQRTVILHTINPLFPNKATYIGVEARALLKITSFRHNHTTQHVVEFTPFLLFSM
jgi:hypothetical protein